MTLFDYTSYKITRRQQDAYEILVRSGKLHQIRDILFQLSALKTDEPIDKLSAFYEINLPSDIIEVAQRQYILSHISNLRSVFHYQLIEAIVFRAPITCGLPRQWIAHLTSLGVPVDSAISSFRWYIYLYGCFFLQLSKSLILIFSGNHSATPPQPNGIHFCDLTLAQIPSYSTNTSSFDIFSWHKASFVQASIPAYHHDISSSEPVHKIDSCISYASKPYEYPKSFFLKLRLLRHLCQYLLNCITPFPSLLRPHHLLICEYVKALLVAYAPISALASEYLFHFSPGSFYRPLWTYIASHRNCHVAVYFYSASTVPTYDAPPTSLRYCFHPFSWDTVYTWSQSHSRYLSQLLLEHPLLIHKPPVWWHPSPGLASPSHKTIAVFDTPSFCPNYFLNINTFGQYTFNNMTVYRDFFSDCLSVAKEFNLKILYKTKRKVDNSVLDPLYLRFLDAFCSDPNVLSISPETSPIALVQNSILTISLPFTSPSFYASYFGLPAIFYDPTSTINPEDSAALSIPILSCRTQLREFLLRLSKQDF